jgi:glycosyltransferase involved in cell wall biosynthesis
MAHLWLPAHCAGAETTANELMKALAQRGHQVVVQLSQPHPRIVNGPYGYEGISVYPHVSQHDPLKWLNHVDGKPDLIVAHLENALRASILGDMHKIPTVVLLHNGHTKSFADLRWGCKLAVYNTEWMRADAEVWWRTHHNGTPPLSIVVHPPIIRERYRVKPPSASTGHVTLINLFEEKGSDVFYALAARFPRLKFLGVRGAYGAQDVRRGLPNVEIIPHVAAHDMPRKVFARTRILLMPSSYESYGRAGVEAACSGIPTIAHPTAGLLEALGDGGTFCDRDDLSAWMAALQRLTAPREWLAASVRARGVADRLDTDADLDRWVAAAESLVPATRRLARV